MIVPQYWAEARLRDRIGGRQVTLRRFGWSDESQSVAQAHAETRLKEAQARFVAGEKIRRLESRVPYNGADGLPIREEIVSRHGEAVVTRNLYGALCLNTPNILFADIDFNDELSFLQVLPLFLVACYPGWRFLHPLIGTFLALLGGILLGLGLTAFLYPYWKRLFVLVRGGSEKRARSRIDSFVKNHPDWRWRLYRTPAGFRLLALHRTFKSDEPAVGECFTSLGVDPIYARMCRNQQCFRARVSPKPWRIGIVDHMKPRPGIWPIKPERLADRTRWIEVYERAARGYASCQFIEEIGSGAVDSTARTIQVLHDEFCRAQSTLPTA